MEHGLNNRGREMHFRRQIRVPASKAPRVPPVVEVKVILVVGRLGGETGASSGRGQSNPRRWTRC